MDFLTNELTKPTVVFGLKLWVVVCIGVGFFIVLILSCLCLFLCCKRKSSSERQKSRVTVSRFSTDTKGRKSVVLRTVSNGSSHSSRNVLQTPTERGAEVTVRIPQRIDITEKTRPRGLLEESMVNRHNMHQMDLALVETERRGIPRSRDRGSNGSGDSRSGGSPASAPGIAVPEVSHLGWGHWYTLRELEMATNSFSDANVLGEGGYGIVYWGQLPEGTRIAVKSLLNNRGQAEREFKIEVEAIGRVRHKNLVRLIGYCMEGSQRMLVYEYIDNGNLEQWLHGQLGDYPPLTWDTRMKIILGTAKGLAYLHEGLEPKVVHRDIKSSNILLDSQWNPKVADFGLAKLLGTENSHVTTRVMGTFGYVAPEYALTGMLTEKSDVYSFGVLMMEVVTGRVPVDFSRPAGEVNLVDWLKAMVSNQHLDEVLDPKIELKPPPRSLKRALLVALRCVDPDAQKRPKMGQVVHMLEADDNPFREERKNSRDPLRQKNTAPNVATPTEGQSDAPPQRKIGRSRGSSEETDRDKELPGDRHANRWRKYES